MTKLNDKKNYKFTIIRVVKERVEVEAEGYTEAFSKLLNDPSISMIQRDIEYDELEEG